MCKAKLGELMPARPPEDRDQGRGGKESSAPSALDLGKHATAAYRKLAQHYDRLGAYCEAVENEEVPEDVPRRSWAS